MNEMTILKHLSEGFIESIADSGDYKFVDFLREATYSLETLKDDSGPYGYTEYEIHIVIGKSKYDAFSDKIDEYNEIASNYFRCELDKHNRIVGSRFIKKSVKYIDWTYLKGSETKESLIEKLSREKYIMISVATGKNWNDYKHEFQHLHSYLTEILPKIFLKHVHSYKDLNSMFRDLQAKFKTYKERTIYLNELFDHLLVLISQSVVKDEYVLEPVLTKWDEINMIINKMIVAKNEAKEPIDYQTVGLYGREVIKKLAILVYNDELHHPSDYPEKVGADDTKLMLSGYIENKLRGRKYKVERSHLFSLMELVNGLTHDKMANLFDANICVNAVIFMINLVHIIETIIPTDLEIS